MITVGVFHANDIPEADKSRWEMNVDVLGLNYERMLTTRVIEAGFKMFGDSTEAGGGGRASKTRKDDVSVYMLVLVSNDE